jgi:ribose 5-phosphate isomerase B
MKKYNIAIASDHSGYNLKKYICKYLEQNKISFIDLGTNDDQTHVDYPDYAQKVTDSITESEAVYGILICGTGIGMSIAANRRSNIRAALCTDLFMAERAKLHNNANVLVLGAKIVQEKLATDIVDKFLSTQFEGGRHASRIAKIH